MANQTREQGEGEGGIRNPGGDQKIFRCADVGNAECRWEVSGRTEEQLMPQIERHGHEAHGIQNIDDKMRNKIRNAIHERRAA